MADRSEFIPHSQAYWNTAADKYERVFTGTAIGRMWRDSVWHWLDMAFHSESRILELNCGTGIDAIHLARRGVLVLGCDISPRMIELARDNARMARLEHRINFCVLPSEDLALLNAHAFAGTVSVASFDGGFSNFSGLNCVDDLAAVRRNLATHLRLGAPLLLCMLGRINLWGRLRHLIRGNFVDAFRSTADIVAAQGSELVKVKYPSCREIEMLFAPEFELRRWKGVGVAIPPAYMEGWVMRMPGLARILNGIEGLIAGIPGLRALGACVLLEFERVPSLPEDGDANPASLG